MASQPLPMSEVFQFGISVSALGSGERHFWVDSRYSDRVLRFEWRHENANAIVISEYDVDNSRDALPVSVRFENFRDNQLRTTYRFTRRNSAFNFKADSRVWTLNGLEMPIGTEVVDKQLKRRIGYWDGMDLSDEFIIASQAEKLAVPPQDPTKLLALAQEAPESPLALDCVAWIIANTPDGPMVQKASEILIEHHVGHERLDSLCERLVVSHSKYAETIFRAILKTNQHRLVLARACFGLATHLKERCDTGDANSESAREAERLYERLRMEFGDIDLQGQALAEIAERQLFELQNLGIGQVAPEITGQDDQGQMFKLSDYRGKVVLLTFSANWCGPCVAMYPQHRSLLEKWKSKPFTILSVNADLELQSLRESIDAGKISWRCWWDGKENQIASAWNVTSWPAIYVIDSEGIIRYKNIRGERLALVIERVIAETTEE
jgi:peroxiredoxin